jgi:hypothetical protein
MGGTRHAKNQCTQAHYSHSERIADGYGTQKQRLGGESLLPFGMCPISLKPLEDPMVSKKGDVFSKAAIIEYLAFHKLQERGEKAEYLQAKAEQDQQTVGKAAAEEQAELVAFTKAQTGFAGTSAVFKGLQKDSDAVTSADLGNRGAISYVDVEVHPTPCILVHTFSVPHITANTLICVPSRPLGVASEWASGRAQGKVFVPQGEGDVSLKRPNPWAHAEGHVKDKVVKVATLEGLDEEAKISKQLEVRSAARHR